MRGMHRERFQRVNRSLNVKKIKIKFSHVNLWGFCKKRNYGKEGYKKLLAFKICL